MRVFILPFLSLTIVLLSGCASQGDSEQQEQAPFPGSWRVEDIDRGGVIDHSQVTLRVDQAGHVSGSTGCNRYTGSVDISEQRFAVTGVATTRRACVPAIAQQEQRFLAALNAAAQYELDAGIWLKVSDETGTSRLKLTKMTPAAEQEDVDQKDTHAPLRMFDCESVGRVGVRFLGAETIEISTATGTAVLSRKRAASGAQYADDNLRFWNKGDTASLRIDGKDFGCRRVE